MENKAQPEADAEGTMFDNFMSIFQRRNSTPRSPVSADPLNSIPFLSPIANSVVSRSSKILNTPSDELRSSFDTDTVETDHQSITYARNFIEFCSYRALNVLTTRPDYLSDKEFRRLTYDMMLAWEAPCPRPHPQSLNKETASPGKTQGEDEDGWSLFYSSSTDMAVQVVDNENTVGLEAFARIAPACAVIADVATVQNLFDALTNTSGNRLHFLLYDKYLQSLDRVIKSAKNVLSASSNLKLADEELIVDVDGTVPTQPILQHIGISAWPGRLTLSSKALYFESLGVGQYDKPAQYDLSRDLKQVIKPELTGPLGARLFDKAVMYRSISLAEPIFLEFPEFKGSSRRDYWLDVTLEILLAHRFVRKYHLKGIQESEAIARAILGIFRCRAVREGFHFFSSHYKTLLVFNLAENLPGGDTILETLSSCLALLEASTAQADSSGSVCTKKRHTVSPVSLLALKRFGLVPHDNVEFDEEGIYSSGYVSVGEADPLEVAVKQSKVGTGKAEAAQETVNQVKVDGIDANIAIMKELLFPLILLAKRIQFLASWEEPFKSTVFLVLMCYLFVSGWFKFVVPFILVSLVVLMLWQRLANNGKLVDAFRIVVPPDRNAVEQLIALQEAISQVEAMIQAVNVVLLKMRALLFAVLPEATFRVAIFLLVTAAFFTLVPLRFIILFAMMEPYTREMPLRKESSYKWLRRLREWWFGIPAAPVQLIKHEDSKKKK